VLNNRSQLLKIDKVVYIQDGTQDRVDLLVLRDELRIPRRCIGLHRLVMEAVRLALSLLLLRCTRALSLIPGPLRLPLRLLRGTNGRRLLPAGCAKSLLSSLRCQLVLVLNFCEEAASCHRLPSRATRRKRTGASHGRSRSTRSRPPDRDMRVSPCRVGTEESGAAARWLHGEGIALARLVFARIGEDPPSKQLAMARSGYLRRLLPENRGQESSILRSTTRLNVRFPGAKPEHPSRSVREGPLSDCRQAK
jgi:hypothetical protein